MIINSTLIFCLIPELKEALLGLKIGQIYLSPDKMGLLFCLRGKNKEADLYSSAHPENCRIEISEKDEKEEHKKDFQKTNLFSFATGGYVQKIEQLDFDRVIKIFCEKKTQFGAGESFALIFELTGRNSNVILMKQETIVDCLKKIDVTQNRFRQILPGRKYFPPPTPKKKNPFSIGKEDFCELVRASNKSISEWLSPTYLGMDDLLAQKIITVSGLDPKKKVAELTLNEIESLWHSFSDTFMQISNHSLTFQVIIDEQHHPQAIGYINLPFIPEDRKIYCESLNSAVKTFFSLKLGKERQKNQTHKLSLIVQRSLKKLEEKSKKIEEDLKQAERFEEYKRFGELLMMNKQNVKKGQTLVELFDIFDPAHPKVEIPLNPKLTAIGNAHSYFKKHKKAKDALNIIRKRRAETEDQITQLNTIAKQLKDDMEKINLEEIESSLTRLGFLGKPISEIKRGKGSKYSPRRFVTKSGWEILVGRNNTENDYLTFKFARPDDLWFHAQDVPGSHVLLRKKDKKLEASSSEIKEAARVAAHFSKARKEKKAEVIYTQAKYVRKPKGRKPGLALVEKEKSILVEPGLPNRA